MLRQTFLNTLILRSVLASEDNKERCLREDGEAEFTAMVERQSRFAFRIAYSLLRNSQDAEDAVQETLLKLYKRRAWIGLRDERAFVARAVWRTGLDKLRQRRPHADSNESALAELASDAPDPERNAVAAAWNRQVHALVDRLPEELRQPLALSTVDGMNSREIAELMAIPEGTVRTRLMRARQILREKLAAQEEFEKEFQERSKQQPRKEAPHASTRG
jgi:RNA polymerase sigma-70 factor (ECF subfamily)